MNHVMERIKQARIVPVIAMERAEDAPALARALLAGGVSVMEVTFRTDAAAEAIERIAEQVPDMLVGAGTVLNELQAEDAMLAGAQFIVSPGLDEETVEFCRRRRLPVFPGCATPTEMQAALNLGLTHIKFFPAEQAGGLSYLKAVSAAYPALRFMPTGGIGPGNLRDYLAWEKIFACGGSWMCPKALIDAGEWARITQLCKEAVSLL